MGLEIGVVGDFSGRDGGNGLAERLAGKSLLTVDADAFDALVGRVAPEVELALPFAPKLPIRRFDDLGPDALRARLPAPPPDAGGAGAESLHPPASGREVLDEILGGAALPAPPPPSDPIDRAIRRIVEASGEPIDRAAERRRRSEEEVVASQLRRILGHPRWQALEVRWRALHGLARDALEVRGARIRLLDLGPEDLLGDLDLAGGRADGTVLQRWMAEGERGTRGGSPFDLIVADLALEPGEVGRRLVGVLARLSASAGCPVLAGCGAALCGVTPDRVDAPAEGDLRELAALAGGGRVGLAAPRVLVRAPYGAEGEPVDGFDFEELAGGEGRLLWGNGAWIVATVALAAASRGLPWTRLAEVARVPGLPMAIADRGGEKVQIGPAERLLSERELERLAACGLVPIAGIRGSDAVQVAALRALGGGPLFGARGEPSAPRS